MNRTAQLYLGIYLLSRAFLHVRLPALSSELALRLDTLFVVGVIYHFKAWPRLSLSAGNARTLLDMMFALSYGGIIFLGGVVVASTVPFVMPFDLREPGSLLSFVVLRPIFEELTFRHAMWAILHPLIKIERLTIFAMAILAMAASLDAYQVYYQNFFIFQALYTFFTSLWMGYRYVRTKSLADVVLLHMGLNLGFYLVFRVIDRIAST